MLWILSSGTTADHQNSFKLIGLTQRALLASAGGVNAFLQVTREDRWLNVLPLFHVGGLGVLYRSYLAGIFCLNLWTPEYRWQPADFARLCTEQKITLTSLVPTQLFDLLRAQVPVPPSLRGIVIGGAQLSPSLYAQARRQGWPLLPSFGMTEAASQIATAALASLQGPASADGPLAPPLTVLPHIEVRTDSQQRLSVRGASLMEGHYPVAEGVAQNWIPARDPDGWWSSNDLADLNNGYLWPLGRLDDVVKIRGENVNLASLRQTLLKLAEELGLDDQCLLLAIPQDRLGHQLVLVGEASAPVLRTLADRFNARVLPFEKVETIFDSQTLPRNELGKVSVGLLRQKVERLLR
jgi:O-succinylbenzoic acid--CoA ligase